MLCMCVVYAWCVYILYMCLYSFAFSNKTINHVLKYYEISFIVHALSLPFFSLLSIIIKVVNHVRKTGKNSNTPTDGAVVQRQR